MPRSKLPRPYVGDEHESFLWKAGDHAALLLHGFPGTPAEMRPLGMVLRDTGWTVHGLILPGLGADFASLEEHKFQDWSDAAIKGMLELKTQHSVVHLSRLLYGRHLGSAQRDTTGSGWPSTTTTVNRRPLAVVLCPSLMKKMHSSATGKTFTHNISSVDSRHIVTY